MVLLGPIRDLGTARDIAVKFALTIRQQPLYTVRTYLSNEMEEDSDSDMLEFQDRASYERPIGRVGRMKRKMLWWNTGQGLVDICWYWDYDG